MTYELPVVDILLATYNGEKFIRTQIDSVINQTYTNWKLIVRDDGSTDNTVEIIKKYVKHYPNKIKLIEDTDRNLGPSNNFSRLLASSTAEYIMFCDQDDLWKENKVEITLKRMLEVEKKLNQPILVHTDLEIVDRELNTISDSMFDFQNLNKHYVSINQLLVQNNVTGCTVMINKKLKELAEPIPTERITMHDWWLALVAAAFGRIEFVDEATIKYRQHGNNDVGAKKYTEQIIKKTKAIDKMYDVVSDNFVQAKTFFDRYRSTLDNHDREVVSQYINLMTYNPFKRIAIINKYKFQKQGFIRNLGFKLIAATIKNENKG